MAAAALPLGQHYSNWARVGTSTCHSTVMLLWRCALALPLGTLVLPFALLLPLVLPLIPAKGSIKPQHSMGGYCAMRPVHH